ncbi:MAG TPA: bifunctional riboflavin kinase/FAD synthetase [Gammaproteobacteria bacterium]|nr:bifunctional riboflavin kinase/FAD synthetase [Gammaproteobacteria bacterium]
MELIRGLHNLRPRHAGGAVTIGSYDGVHLGHQAVLRRLREAADAEGCKATMISFEPSPREFLCPADPPARLTRLREKCEALAACDVDSFLCLRFDRRLSEWTAGEFAERVLVAGLNSRFLIVGRDFRFGRGREGDVGMLREFAGAHGIRLEVAADFAVDGERVSSTAVRHALAEGRLDDARRLLGRWYRMSGRVIGGRRLGRELGYATANIDVQRRSIAVQGIFAVRVHGLGDDALPGVASIGTRPTVQGGQPLLEVHLFDFDADIYGRRLHVDFVAKLRNEARFDSLDDMKAQMRADSDTARAILASAEGAPRRFVGPG